MTKSDSYSNGWKEPENIERIFGHTLKDGAAVFRQIWRSLVSWTRGRVPSRLLPVGEELSFHLATPLEEVWRREIPGHPPDLEVILGQILSNGHPPAGLPGGLLWKDCDQPQPGAEFGREFEHAEVLHSLRTKLQDRHLAFGLQLRPMIAHPLQQVRRRFE